MYEEPQRTGADFGATRKTSPIDRFASTPSAVMERNPGKLNRLDSPEALRLHGNLLSHHIRELERQNPNRREMALDERFYDNDPWSEAEKMLLAKRGQLATNYNVVSTTINWILGTELRGRTDFKIYPRRPDGSKPAERKTSLLKYLGDANNSDWHWSAAFADAQKAGLGWMESGWQDDTDGEPIYDRRESWRNILWDSLAKEPDLMDGRYQFRTKWVDADLAIAQFPDRQSVIETACTGTSDFGGRMDRYGDDAMDEWEDSLGFLGRSTGAADIMSEGRDRVRLIEAWFRKPVMSTLVRGGDFHGELFDEFSEGHRMAIAEGQAELIQRPKMRMHVAIMTTTGLLYLGKSPYRHNRFPFTPIWCYRRGSDGMPYGVIRNLRDLQTHINRAAARAQHILSTNKTVMEKGAVDDLDEFEEEVARPDAIIVVNPGKKLDMAVDRELAPAHLDLMSRMISMVQSQSGVTDESLGRTTNAVSGKAIIARQDQGSLATAIPFDNLRLARKLHGEKMLSLTEQFMSDKKSFRITNERGTPEYITINDGTAENDISKTKSDFIVGEGQWNATQRQAQVQSLMDMIKDVAPGAPEILKITLDLIVEAMDIPNRDEIVKRIRQETGMTDPDADPNAPPTEEELAKAEAMAIQEELAKRGAEAEIASLEAKAAADVSRAAKADADAKKVLATIAGSNIETQIKALEAAMAILAQSSIVPVADIVLKSAGYMPVRTDPLAQQMPPMPAPAPEPVPEPAPVPEQAPMPPAPVDPMQAQVPQPPMTEGMPNG